MDTETMFQRIVASCPAFGPQLEEHLADNEEMLGHVLMGDVGRYIGALFTGQTNLVVEPPSEPEVRNILAVLDEALTTGDAAVKNIVDVSFVEGLWWEPYFNELKPLLTPGLATEVERQRIAWPAG